MPLSCRMTSHEDYRIYELHQTKHSSTEHGDCYCGTSRMNSWEGAAIVRGMQAELATGFRHPHNKWMGITVGGWYDLFV